MYHEGCLKQGYKHGFIEAKRKVCQFADMQDTTEQDKLVKHICRYIEPIKSYSFLFLPTPTSSSMIFIRKMKIEIFFISDVRLRWTLVPSLSSFVRFFQTPPTPLFTRRPLWMTPKISTFFCKILYFIFYLFSKLLHLLFLCLYHSICCNLSYINQCIKIFYL